MNTNWLNTIGIEVYLFITALLLQQSRGANYYDYPDYGGGNGVYDYGGETGGTYDNPKEYNYVYGNDDKAREPFQCYVCHYEVNGDTVTGTANCDDPFNEYDIETVNCYTYCAKFRKQLNDNSNNDYLLTRICLPKCKESHEGLEYTECCDKDKCNGAVPSRSGTYGFTLLTFLCSTLMSLLLNS